MPVVARPPDVRPCDPVDISCADRRENEMGKRERKRGTAHERDLPHRRALILLTDPVARPPARTMFTHVILWILAASVEEKTKWEEREVPPRK